MVTNRFDVRKQLRISKYQKQQTLKRSRLLENLAQIGSVVTGYFYYSVYYKVVHTLQYTINLYCEHSLIFYFELKKFGV